MKKIAIIAVGFIGMMTSCIEEKNREAVAHRIKGDTTTLQVVRVNKNFNVGEVVVPAGYDSTKFKIVRFARK